MFISGVFRFSLKSNWTKSHFIDVSRPCIFESTPQSVPRSVKIMTLLTERSHSFGTRPVSAHLRDPSTVGIQPAEAAHNWQSDLGTGTSIPFGIMVLKVLCNPQTTQVHLLCPGYAFEVLKPVLIKYSKLNVILGRRL